jgi:hypothetical protein
MKVGFGLSRFCSMARLKPRPNQRFLARSAIALSSDCITSSITMRRLQPTGQSVFSHCSGWRAMLPSHMSGRVTRLPLPTRIGVEQRHEVAVATVVDELDVRIVIDVDAAADGDIVPGPAILGQAHGEDRFTVGAHQFAEAVADPGQRTPMLAVGEQLVRAQGASGEDDPARSEGLARLEEPGPGALGRDPAALAAIGRSERHDIHHFVFGQDRGSLLLGEPQIVLDERVLGADPAADHAGAAVRAAGAGRALPPK